MKEVMYDDAFRSLGLIKFSVGMRFQPATSSTTPVFGIHTELPCGLGGHNTAGCPIGGSSEGKQSTTGQV